MPRHLGDFLDEDALDDDDFIAYIARHTPGDERTIDAAPAYIAERPSVEDVLAQAARLAGPLRAATRVVSESLGEPFVGELDIEATLANTLAKPFPTADDIIVQRREERRHQLVIMLDASLSMAGENMNIATVAVAAMALKLRPEDLSVVVFEDEARTVTRLETADPPEEVVRNMLDEPGKGVTNIEAALELGAAELRRGRNPRRSGLLISDGNATKGKADPSELALRFPRLHVLLTEQKFMDEELARRLADVGGGELFSVKQFADLPQRMLDVANRVLR